jgi:plasmid stabilization system protein ParE
MAEKYKINWSAESKKQVDLICAFIRKRWNQKEADNFLDLLMHFERTVASFPKAYKTSPTKKTLRLGIIHKNATVVYTVKKNSVYIVIVFDNRMSEDYR